MKETTGWNGINDTNLSQNNTESFSNLDILVYLILNLYKLHKNITKDIFIIINIIFKMIDLSGK